MRLYAPYLSPTAQTFLTDPILNNSRAPRHRVNIRPMMDGTRRTLVSSTDRQRFGLSFRMYVDKAQELREFVRAYRNVEWGLEFDGPGDLYRAFLMTNPLSFESVRKDTVEVTIEFQGTEVI